MSHLQVLSQAIVEFKKVIQSHLENIDLKSYIFQAIQEDYYTKRIDGFYHTEIFYQNETLSHTVKFSNFTSIVFRRFLINYHFFYQDIKVDLSFSVVTDNNDAFIVVLKCNHDLSVYDVEYWVD